MVKEMPVRAVAKLVGEHDTRVWRVVHHYVDAARAGQDLSEVERVGVDETSFGRARTTCRCSQTSTARARSSRPRAAGRRSLGASWRILPPTAARRSRSQRSARTCPRPTWPGRSPTCPRRRSPSTATTSRRSSPRPSTRSAAQSAGAGRAAQTLALPVAAQPQQAHRAPARTPRRAARRAA